MDNGHTRTHAHRRRFYGRCTAYNKRCNTHDRIAVPNIPSSSRSRSGIGWAPDCSLASPCRQLVRRPSEDHIEWTCLAQGECQPSSHTSLGSSCTLPKYRQTSSVLRDAHILQTARKCKGAGVQKDRNRSGTICHGKELTRMRRAKGERLNHAPFQSRRDMLQQLGATWHHLQ